MKKVFVLSILILVVTAPLYSYVAKRDLLSGVVLPIKWPTASITWVLNPTQGANVTGARSLSTVMQASFDAWDAVTTANFTFTRGIDAVSASIGNDGINVVKMNLAQADYNTIAGSALGLTLTTYNVATGALVDADIILNPGVSFSTDLTTPSTRIDLQSVATHEIGHLLGLDHSAILSATMFPRIGEGMNAPRVLSTDDIAGVSSIYPTAAFLSKGSISGTVRFTSNALVYGAIVVAVNSNGQPVAHGVSDPFGNYTINGLDAGTYTIYAEPMDTPYEFSDQDVLNRIYPGSTITTAFTTRFR